MKSHTHTHSLSLSFSHTHTHTQNCGITQPAEKDTFFLTVWAEMRRPGVALLDLTWGRVLPASQIIPCSVHVSFPGVSVVKNLPVSAGNRRWGIDPLGWEDPLEEEMATHSSIFAWKISWTEEPGGLYSSWGCKESDPTEHTHCVCHKWQQKFWEDCVGATNKLEQIGEF